ncbi:Hypothetical predicted protein [Pelobates cultripes]|uniref:Phospholipid scramblase n=1 Tax=Pelobates cultripes TaxID=61616 RepID=A0AAD1RKG6_PELCU|nr:Hypothetical predicted protein [Pelobates cultripes]
MSPRVSKYTCGVWLDNSVLRLASLAKFENSIVACQNVSEEPGAYYWKGLRIIIAMDLQGTPGGSGQVPPIQSQPSGSSAAESLWIPVAEPQGGRGLEYLRPVKTVEQRSEVGMINMRFLRLGMCTYNKDYEIQFPLDLDVKLKALLLSTGLLFDFLFYQRNG